MERFGVVPAAQGGRVPDSKVEAVAAAERVAVRTCPAEEACVGV